MKAFSIPQCYINQPSMSFKGCSAQLQGLDDAKQITESRSLLPIKEIPGSYGIPFITPIKDRLDYFYHKGEVAFFQSKIERYNSTVFRTNMPPGPFIASNPRVITVLDGRSFRVLFDTNKIEKKDVLTGTYMPTTKLTGGYRVCSYLDPSEPNHTNIKQFLFNLLASRKDAVIPAFRSSFALPIFSAVESQLASNGRADFNTLNEDICFEFLGEAFFGLSPSKAGAKSLQSKANIWLSLQLAPLAGNVITKYLPWVVEDLLLHTFPLPFFIAKPSYKQLYNYFMSAGAAALDSAETLGLSRDEACNNLLFTTCFNAHAGLKVLFPTILKWLALSGNDLHGRLAAEVRAAVDAENGRVTMAALENMDLTKSVVYEALRIEPPVRFQYGHAKKDFVLESHDAAFEVRKGEMIFGYQPIAMRDPKVFGANADKFVADRFMGNGEKLLSSVFWSNGPETESPTVQNKQCAGKNLVVLLGRLFVAEFFLHYDSLTAKSNQSVLGPVVTVTGVTKAKTKLNGGD